MARPCQGRVLPIILQELAYPEGLEPSRTVLETDMLPLHQGYIISYVEKSPATMWPVEDITHIDQYVDFD